MKATGLLAALAVAVMLAAPALPLLAAVGAAGQQAGIIAVAQSDQPFKPLKVIENAENKNLHAAWSAVAFLRAEGGGYTPYLLISSHTYALTSPSATLIYNMETWEVVDQRSISGPIVLQVTENKILMPSLAHDLFEFDIINFAWSSTMDSYWSGVEEYDDGYVLHIAKEAVWYGITYVVRVYRSGYTNSYSFTIADDDVEAACGANYDIVSYPATMYPAASNEPIALEAFVAKTASVEETQYTVVFVAVNMTDGSIIDLKCHNFGSYAENLNAVKAFFTRSTSREPTMYADGIWPYLVGTDGADEFYVVKYEGGKIEVTTVDAESLLVNPASASVRLVRDSGGGVHVVVFTESQDGVPMVRFIDPESLSIEKTVALDGYSFDYPVIEKGLYYGQPAVYLGVRGYVVVVSVDDMDVVYAFPTVSGDVVKAIDFNRGTAGQTLMVRVFNTTTNKHNIELYTHVTAMKGTRVTLRLSSDSGVVGGSVEATVTLTTLAGQPLAGRTVHVEELVRGEWVTVASGVTGSDGTFKVSLALKEKGIHYYRAVYAGGEGEAPCVSSVVRVTAYREAEVSLKAPAAWPSTLPVSVEVTVEDANTGEPLAGYWVTVYANFTWGDGPVGSAKTDYSGKAVVSAKLPPGVYELTATVDDALVTVKAAGKTVVRIVKPGTPPPEGPYIAPVGRVVGMGPAVTEPGRSAIVVFAFYYGDLPTEPDSYSVVVTPDAEYKVERVDTGVYKVTVTPSSVGVYTVLFKADYYGAYYIGAASVLSLNVTGRLDEWDEAIGGVLSDLQTLRTVIEEYLRDINETLATANMTQLYLLVNESHNILLRVDENLVLALDAVQALDLKASWVLANLTEVKTITLSNGEVLAVIAGDVEVMASLLRDVNATLAGIAGGVAVIKSDVGTILARTSDILESAQAIGSDVFKIKTILGVVQANLTSLAGKMDEGFKAVAAELAKLNGTIAGVLVEVRDGKALLITLQQGQAQLQAILLDDLKPQIAAVGDKLAVLNTTLGLVAAKVDDAREAASQAAQSAADANTRLDELSSKIDQLSQEIQGIKAMLEEQAQAKPEGDTTARAIGGAGLAAGLAALAAALLRRP